MTFNQQEQNQINFLIQQLFTSNDKLIVKKAVETLGNTGADSALAGVSYNYNKLNCETKLKNQVSVLPYHKQISYPLHLLYPLQIAPLYLTVKKRLSNKSNSHTLYSL